MLTSCKGGRAYDRSKRGSVLLSVWWADELRDTGITSNALEPGMVRTDFARSFRGAIAVMARIMRVFMKSAPLGAATSVYVASAPDVEGVTGAYFGDVERLPAHPDAVDRGEAERFVSALDGIVSGLTRRSATVAAPAPSRR